MCGKLCLLAKTIRVLIQRFPAAVSNNGGDYSWAVAIAPFADQQNLADDIKAGASAVVASDEKLPLLICPSATQEDEFPTFGGGDYTSHYYASMGPAQVDANSPFDYKTALGRVPGSIGLSGVFSPRGQGTPSLLVIKTSSTAFLVQQQVRENLCRLP